MTIRTMTRAKQTLMINLVFTLGLIALAVGLYLHFGVAITLMVIGSILIALSLFAVLAPQKITVTSKAK